MESQVFLEEPQFILFMFNMEARNTTVLLLVLALLLLAVFASAQVLIYWKYRLARTAGREHLARIDAAEGWRGTWLAASDPFKLAQSAAGLVVGLLVLTWFWVWWLVVALVLGLHWFLMGLDFEELEASAAAS